MTNILVIGASRGVGKALCIAAASSGHKVTALSRSVVPMADAQPGIRYQQGDARNAEDIRRALIGVDVVVQALGVPLLEMATKRVSLFSESTRVLIDAMHEIGVNKLVAVTGYGAGDSKAKVGLLHRLLFKTRVGDAYNDKSKQERLVEASDLDWLIIRPGALTNKIGSGKYRVLTRQNDWRNGMIPREDVAHFILTRVQKSQFGREKAVIIR